MAAAGGWGAALLQMGGAALQGIMAGARQSRAGEQARVFGPAQRALLGPGFAVPAAGGEPGYRPRRRRGITAHDLASFRRVANLIRKYAAPVRHFRRGKR